MDTSPATSSLAAVVANRLPATDKRDNRQAPVTPLPPAAATATSAPADNRQPTTGNRDKRFTRAEAAAELGVSVSALRRLQQRTGRAGELVPLERGGSVRLLDAEDLAALAAASATSDKRQPTSAPADNRDNRLPASDKRQAVDLEPAAAGWRELVAEVRSESDRLRAELAVTRERLDQLERRAGEAERGRLEAAARVEALRAAWWRWYALAQARPWWRRRLPDAPAELTAGPALPPPQR